MRFLSFEVAVILIKFTTAQAGFALEEQTQIVVLCTEGTPAHMHVEKLSRTKVALQERTGERPDHGIEHTFAKLLHLSET